MIKANPEIVPFKVGDTVALIQDMSDIYTVLYVEPTPFGHLLKLEDAQHKVIWDWSTYYITTGVAQ